MHVRAWIEQSSPRKKNTKLGRVKIRQSKDFSELSNRSICFVRVPEAMIVVQLPIETEAWEVCKHRGNSEQGST